MLMLGMTVSLAAPVSAGEIKGKWGLSAPVTLNRTPETFAVLYAHSNRSVWAFDLSLAFRDQMTGSSGGRIGGANALSFAVGPRLRSYRHPDEELSFYFDRFLRVFYARSEVPGVGGIVYTLDRRTAEFGLGMGCEYFSSRFHCGLALHSDFGRLAYVEDGKASNLTLDTNSTKRSIIGTAIEASYSVQPSIALRAYF